MGARGIVYLDVVPPSHSRDFDLRNTLAHLTAALLKDRILYPRH